MGNKHTINLDGVRGQIEFMNDLSAAVKQAADSGMTRASRAG